MLHQRKTPIRYKHTLKQLFNCYFSKPQSEYVIEVRKGAIITSIKQNYEDSFSSQNVSIYENESNIYPNSKERKVKQNGLFANLIKNMQICKPKQKEPQSIVKPKKYQYYFQVFKHKENMQNERNNSNLSNQQSSYISIQQNLFAQSRRQVQKKIDDGKKNHQPFIDIDFSFEQISNQMHSIKIAKNQFENESNNSIDKQSVKQEQISIKEAKTNQVENNALKQLTYNNKPQQVNFAKLSKQLNKVINGPSPLNSNLLLARSQSSSKGVQGAKRVQSRIIQKQGSINIDFDIDLNFI